MKQIVEVIMPQLAESLVSATIDKWLKQPGDYIDMYEPIADLITDKVTAELPATVSGTLVEVFAQAGETVLVGAPICTIEVVVEGEAEAAPSSSPTNTTATPPAAPTSSQGQQPQVDASLRGRYSPAVLTLAAQHNIDPASVPGTGLGGRVTRKDILAYVAAGGAAVAKPQAQPAVATPTPAPVTMKVPPASTHGLHLPTDSRIKIEVEGQEIPGRGEMFIDVTPIRNTIAQKMRQSVTEIPHGWMMVEVDLTNLVILRSKLKDEFKKREGVNLTYLAFFMQAVVNAIKAYPIMNSVWAVDKIIVKRDINISLSVGTEDSVITPVIRNADQKNIAGLAREIDGLARKTRDGKLRLDDIQGGTFTVNNTGSFGSILSQPIINYPQAAIITIESIVKRPVIINDMLAVRSMANVCLSLDHRILDGVICGRFLQHIKESLESIDVDTKVY